MKRIVVGLSIAVCSNVVAGELTLSAGVDASYININSDSGANNSSTSDTFQIQPAVSANFTSKKLRTNVSARHKYLDRHISTTNADEDTDGRQSNFTDYNYAVDASVVDNVLSVNARGAQSYRNTNVGSALINDEVFGSQQLAKTQRNSLGFNLNLPNPDYVAFSLSARATEVKSDRTETGNTSLNSDNVVANAVINQGDEIKNVNWSIVGTYQDTNGSGRNDVISETLEGIFRVGVIGDLHALVTGRQESNELKSSEVDSTRNRDYDSYGAGVSWYQSESRFIDLTYNVSTKQNDEFGNEEDEREKFLGVNFNWRLTSRTSVSGNLGRRFYGRSGEFTLEHNIRKFRTSISYQEDLTTYSRLVAGDQVIGVFVCPEAIADLSQCFQPDSIEYDLQPGEQFTAFDFTIPEISDEVILRKSLLANFGYEFRRLRANLTLRSSDTEYLESNRDQTSLNANLALNLELGRRSSVSWNNSYSQVDRDIEGESRDDDVTWVSSLGYNYKVNKQLSTRVGIRYTERQSPVESRDFSSRRMTFTVKYTFK